MAAPEYFYYQAVNFLLSFLKVLFSSSQSHVPLRDTPYHESGSDLICSSRAKQEAKENIYIIE